MGGNGWTGTAVDIGRTMPTLQSTIDFTAFADCEESLGPSNTPETPRNRYIFTHRWADRMGVVATREPWWWGGKTARAGTVILQRLVS